MQGGMMNKFKKGINYILIEGQYLSIISEALTALETRIKASNHEKKQAAINNITSVRKMLNEAPTMII